MLSITAYSLANALGTGRNACLRALQGGVSGLAPLNMSGVELRCHAGLVSGLDEQALPSHLRQFDCRNNRLAERVLLADDFVSAVENARHRYGSSRIGVFLGTSTSGIACTEEAYAAAEDVKALPPFNFQGTHSLGALSEYVAERLGLTGPTATVSTACSSSAKVFGMARRYVDAGFCDAAVVGGVDTLCLTTLYGFNALELVSEQPARPWGRHRDGISIGEGGGLALLEPAVGGDTVLFLGYGESSDAHHMSTPHPQGVGALQAIDSAITSAGVDRVEYVNLHGTGTPSNDGAEDQAVVQAFGRDTWCSSTKGATGHTLGGAGITEALFCCIAIEEGMVPGGVTEPTLDPALNARFATRSFRHPVRRAASLSLGFGGSNCCLIFGRGA